MAEGAVSGKAQIEKERRQINKEVRNANAGPHPRRSLLSDILRELKRIRVQLERQDGRQLY